jgi:hypothetical protein
VKSLPNFKSFNKDNSLNELAHPSRIVLKSPKQRYLSHFNELQRSYKRLEDEMIDAGQPQEDIDKVKAKADDMFNHLRTLNKE